MNERKSVSAILTGVMAFACGGTVAVDAGGSGTTSAATCRSFTTATELSPPLQGSAYDDPASDGRHVYFSDGQALYRVPVSGGDAELLYEGRVDFFAAGGGVAAWAPVTDTGTPIALMIKTAEAVQPVALPDGVLPSGYSDIVADADGNVFFNVDMAVDGSSATWRWDPATNLAEPMPGVGSGDGQRVNLYGVDRGEIIWSALSGLYSTQIATGIPRLLVDDGGVEFGNLVGVDAENVYGAGSLCDGPCPFTIYGVPRLGGEPFVAFQTAEPYWVQNLRADDSGLYWVDWETSAFFHAALNPSGPAVELRASNIEVARFALDACNLYWLEVSSSRPIQDASDLASAQTTRVAAISKSE